MDLRAHQSLILHHLLATPALIADCSEELRSDHWPEPECGRLYREIVSAATVGRTPHTLDSLIEWVLSRATSDGERELLGGVIAETVNFAGTTRNDFGASINALRMAHRRRILLSALHESALRVESGRDEEAESCLVTALDALQNTTGAAPCVRAADAVDDALARYDRAKAGEKPVAIPTGFKKIDAVTGGIEPTHVWILGAAPSQGKTANAREVAYSALMCGFSVLYVTLEMEAHEILRGFHVRHANAYQHGEPIPVRAVTDGTLSPNQEDQYRHAVGDFAQKALTVWAPDGATIEDVQRRVAAMQMVRPVDLLIVDYLQLLQPSERRRDMREHLVHLLRATKRMARKMKLRVLGLWQMRREAAVAAEERGHYLMQDLAETAEAERTADVIMWSLYTPQMEAEREMQIGIAKARHAKKLVEGYRVAALMDLATVVDADFDAGYAQ